MKYKPGEQAKVREDLESLSGYNDGGWLITFRKDWIGKILTIKYVFDGYYTVEENPFFWFEDCFENNSKEDIDEKLKDLKTQIREYKSKKEIKNVSEEINKFSDACKRFAKMGINFSNNITNNLETEKLKEEVNDLKTQIRGYKCTINSAYGIQSKKHKLRKLGDITSDLEPLIQEMVYEHELQWGEILSLIHGYLMIHCPDAREEYEDGSNPKYYYGD